MSLTIAEYFDRLATEGLGIYVSEEFDNAIVDTLEIIRNHNIGDFENIDDSDSEFTDEEDWTMNKDQFIEEIYEIAFGDNAINRDFPFEEVIERIQEFSDNALKYEEGKEWMKIIYGLYLMMLTKVL